jgi:hypothetical protein
MGQESGVFGEMFWVPLPGNGLICYFASSALGLDESFLDSFVGGGGDRMQIPGSLWTGCLTFMSLCILIYNQGRIWHVTDYE